MPNPCFDATTFGEMLLRLSVPSGERLENAHQLDIHPAGAEGALRWDRKDWQHQPSPATQIVDRLGAGDALAAGVTHGWLDGDLSAGLRYGTTLAALALTQFVDMVLTNRSELLRLSQRGSSLTQTWVWHGI